MKKCKRLVTLFLAVCLVLSMTVPAVWAEEDDGVLTYSFGTGGTKYDVVGEGGGVYNGYTKHNANEAFPINDKVTYLNQSAVTTNAKASVYDYHTYLESIYTSSYFQESAIEAKGWIAFQINDVKAGTYDMAIQGQNTKGGVFKVYVVEQDTYTEAITGVTLDNTTVLDSATNSQIISALEKGALNAAETSEICFSKNSGLSKNIGAVTFKNAGNYVVVFQITQMDAGYVFACNDITLTPGAVTYNFDYIGLTERTENTVFLINAEGLKADVANSIDEANLNWNYHSYSQQTTGGPAMFVKSGYNFKNSYTTSVGYFRMFTADVGDYVAFTIDNPGEGSKMINVKLAQHKYGVKTCNVYLLPAEGVSDVGAAIKAAEPVGTVDFYNGVKYDNSDYSGSAAVTDEVGLWTPDASYTGDYILVFEAAELSPDAVADDNTSKMFISSLTIGREKSEGSDVIVKQVTGKVAADNIVPNYKPVLIATSEVNGHDYVYVVLEGSILFVYDLDADKLIDSEKLAYSTPRDIYVDENGIVWISGSSCYIYAYDPVSMTCQKYEFSSKTYPDVTSYNCYGITGDGVGNIYFGIYNRAYFMKFDTKTKQFTSLTDTMLRSYATFAGHGGIIIRDGYAYMCVDGNLGIEDGTQHHELLKFNLTTNQEEAALDISRIFPQTQGTIRYLDSLSLVGDTLIACIDGQYVAVNPDTMQEVTFDGVVNGFYGSITKEKNGKVYMIERGAANDGGRGLLEYDVATGEIKATGCPYTVNYLEDRDCFVTVADMPGVSMVTYMAYEDRIDLIVYNPESGQTKVIRDFTDGRGSGSVVGAFGISPDGKTIYVGGYANNHVTIYDVESKTATDHYATHGYQIESLLWYDGYLYAGNYDSCSITQVDLEAGKAMPMSRISYAPFLQQRASTSAAGDGMVFLGTAPSRSRNGGMLVWYHIAEDRVYVATGPDSDDVYYTDAGILTETGAVIKAADTVWYHAKTGQVADFDLDNDGTSDSYITVDGVTQQIFTGVVTNQTINEMIYQDGYIYGSTSLHGGTGSVTPEGVNACLFVYDVKAMELVATYDLTKSIEGLAQQVPFVDAMAADPVIDGKIWGTVSDTLFSFTFDSETKTFNVKTELVFGCKNYNNGNSGYTSRDIIMDGQFMYVVFGSYGTYMVNREDPQVNYKLSNVIPKAMVLGADGNLYYHSGLESDLMMLPIAEAAQMIKAPYAIESAQALIDALDDAANITLEDEAAVIAARKAYDSLTEEDKVTVDATKLLAAEAAIKPLRTAADQAAAEAVTAQITAIGTVTLESEAGIVAARKAYDALSASQKKLVTNLDTLTAAEKALDILKITPEDRQAAANVDALINGIGTVTMSSKDAIAEARAAYKALTNRQKSLVTSLSVLTQAEEAMAALKAENEKIYNFDYVNSGLKFSGNSLFDSKTLAYIAEYYQRGELNWNVKQVDYSSTLYNDIGFNTIGYFHGRSHPGDWVAFSVKTPGAGIWSISTDYLATYCGAEEVSVYMLAVDTEDIGAALTEENLVAQFNCYDPENKAEKPSLSTLKSDVSGFWTSGDAQEYIMVFQCTKANEDALALYAERKEADPENTRDYGSNVYWLQLIFNRSSEAVLAAQQAIDAIGTVTLESENAITAARSAYDALEAYYQAQITNLDVLTAAEAAFAELKTAAEQEAADKAAVANAEALIAAIGKVTKESGDAIKAARNAYDALTAAQKEMVTSLKVLTDAEAAYADAIKNPGNPDTGDHAPVMLMVCIALISVMAIAAVPVIRKKVN